MEKLEQRLDDSVDYLKSIHKELRELKILISKLLEKF